jgi:hypothetical protein
MLDLLFSFDLYQARLSLDAAHRKFLRRAMDRTESTVRKMLTAIETPLYDIGVLSDRRSFPPR